METNQNDRFYGDENQEDSFNRFDSEESSGGSDDRSQRPRFVRVDYGNRQYSRVDRNRQDYSHENGGYSNRPRQYRQQGEGYNSNSNGYRRYGQQDRNFTDRGYNRQNFDQDRQYGYRPTGGDDQPRFYRERVQGGQNGEYGQRPQYNQQRGFRPRPYSGYGQQRPYGNPGGFPNHKKKKPGIPKSKRIEYQEQIHSPEEEIRLNKFLANAGVCSRREADDFIKAGVVKVNGQTVTELGSKIKRGDNVLFHDQLVSIERKIYILLNKPKDCVTTVDDPQERKTVMFYVKNACKERIYPVGRLDRNTTGVLLLTNDGELATKLTHPRFMKKKVYHAHLDRNVSSEDLDKLLTGVDIGDGDLVSADAANYVNDDRCQIGIEIHSGRNRVVRRMFDALGYKVTKLDRVQFAGLTKKRLRRGDWRFLTEKEVNMLRMGAYE